MQAVILADSNGVELGECGTAEQAFIFGFRFQ